MVCPALATEISGYYKTIPELLKIIGKERTLFDQSGGGVTFSGGEPLLYPNYLIEILDKCGKSQIHRTIDTCGLVKEEILLGVAKRTDLFLYDLKLTDSDKHKQYTGTGNKLILSNLTALAKTGADIQIRIPLIKGINTDQKDLSAMAAFIAGLAGEKKSVSLLPYHATATHKYQKLGEHYLAGNLKEPGTTDLQQAINCFSAHDLLATVGG